ncbi:coiled-coil domain-containing protein [Saliterribacillus persicus]|uniref:Peptidoglycan hydrolase CwlO-like protein n=1 Tax=Saliterribacillus persicus TaxID=930114 RepID=A0A368XHD1_9BACI|nr:C40 family peptidase [Saliterribacillus persicus]RCW67009.1 peptidoglycan hydrolase CwlO-like protein [Saliterribacillus persicus]
MNKNSLSLKNVGIIAIVVTSFLFVEQVKAEPSAEIEAERQEVQQEIKNTETEIEKTRKELIELNEKINRSTEAIADNEKTIDQTEVNIETAEKEVEQIQSSIVDLEIEIEKRNDILKERAASIQKSGGSSTYLEVVFGAESFLDFIDRVSLVNKIAEADKDLLDKQAADKLELEKKKDAVTEKLENLENMMVELEAMQEQILKQKAENEALVAELKEKESANVDILADLNIEEEILANKERAIKEAEAQAEANQASSSTTSTRGNSSQQIEQFAQETKKSSSSSSSQSAPKATGNLQTILTAGNRYFGNSVYVFGGGRSSYDIANGRFDCSGFVSWAFRQGGINLPASTGALSGVGTKVSVSDMRPGDLVFFNTYKTNGHVAIYLGNNKFIGSQNSTGVAIASMNNSYWSSTFKGHVRRVIQ